MRYFRAALCFILTLLLVFATERIVSNKDSIEKYNGFFEQQLNFDVLFFGTSHMQNALSPMDLWENYGITSYNMANSGCRIATSYWMLKCALNHTSPKLVVLDCAYLFRKEKANDNIAYMHKSMDAFPVSTTKIQAIMDLFDDNEQRIEFFFPFTTYHNRWNDIKKEDFFIQSNPGNGYNLSCKIQPAEIEIVDMSNWTEVDSVNVEYLDKFVKLCNEKNIPLLLTFLPFDYSEQSKNDMAFLLYYSSKNSINYLDGNTLLNAICQTTDFYNTYKDNSHLNLSGAQKMTDYIGAYICKHYDIPDRRNDPSYQKWNIDKNDYESYKHQLISELKTLEEYLILASDKHLSVIIETNNNNYLFQNKTFMNLLKNLYPKIFNETECFNENVKYIVIRGNGEKISILTREGSSCLGTISRKRDFESTIISEYVLLNGQKLYLSNKDTPSSAVWITIIDDQNNLIDSECFDPLQTELLMISPPDHRQTR